MPGDKFSLKNCSQWFKDTNLKANHNQLVLVSIIFLNCSQWFKDTNLKANHNLILLRLLVNVIVPNGSKILI